MANRYRIWVGVGGVAGGLAVAAAAAAAHLPLEAAGQRAAVSAVQMHGWHALALVGCGLWGARGGWLCHAAGAAFLLGMLLFCGTIYAAALGGPHVGPLAPAGGTVLMLGWALLAASAVRSRSANT